jgi:ribosomal-protein-alanine N-acetyltransferase
VEPQSSNKLNVKIRPARSEEFETLWRIDQECFAAGIAYSRFELAHYMRRRGAFTLVAEIQVDPQQPPQIAGFIVTECDRRGFGHVITIDVRLEARRFGVGRRLMAAAEEKLKTGNCAAVYLETAVDNLPAIGFYKRLGYSVLKTIPRYYNGELDALLMGKKLSLGP